MTEWHSSSQSNIVTVMLWWDNDSIAVECEIVVCLHSSLAKENDNDFCCLLPLALAFFFACVVSFKRNPVEPQQSIQQKKVRCVFLLLKVVSLLKSWDDHRWLILSSIKVWLMLSNFRLVSKNTPTLGEHKFLNKCSNCCLFTQMFNVFSGSVIAKLALNYTFKFASSDQQGESMY